jgi:hypothetical protein
MVGAVTSESSRWGGGVRGPGATVRGTAGEKAPVETAEGR